MNNAENINSVETMKTTAIYNAVVVIHIDIIVRFVAASDRVLLKGCGDRSLPLHHAVRPLR